MEFEVRIRACLQALRAVWSASKGEGQGEHFTAELQRLRKESRRTKKRALSG
jgi:hypothetical protein